MEGKAEKYNKQGNMKKKHQNYRENEKNTLESLKEEEEGEGR